METLPFPASSPASQFPPLRLLPDPEPETSAPAILASARQIIADRASSRDTPTGERSMGATVAAFNAMFGKDLTETEGWRFMELLKMARSRHGSFNRDDFEDGAAYAALAGECEAEAIKR